MILYAVYTPKEQNSWNRPCVYAFASVERYITALESVKPRSGKLKPVTRDTALQTGTIARFFLGVDKMGVPLRTGGLVDIKEYSVRSSWDGSRTEIQLVEYMADEKIPHDQRYP